MSHYDTYSIYAKRMYAIVRRYAPIVEEYSIDECFGDLSSLVKGSDIRLAVEAASNVKRDLEQDLGMSFSIGLAPSKMLAKVASKWVKPSGFTVLQEKDTPLFLENIPVGKVWGIGPASSANLMKHNVRTALDLAMKPEWWAKENLAKPYQEIWHELNGRSLHRVNEELPELQKSIMKTGTFKPVTKDPEVLLSELSKNTERACRKLRNHKCITHDVSFYIKTQKFTYRSTAFHLDLPTNNPIDIMDEIQKQFLKVYSPHYDYRATGVVFRTITPATTFQSDLFGFSNEVKDKGAIFAAIDVLSHKFGKGTVMLARSLKSISAQQKPKKKRVYQDLPLNIPFWGETV